MPQITNTLLMIEPTRFGFNEKAAETNSFQQKIEGLSDEYVAGFAKLEFENYVELLRKNDVNVITFKDLIPTLSPDSIFPNNWISMHENGKIITYPMEPENRRLERRQDIVDELINRYNYTDHIAFEKWEPSKQYLEGTGSIVFDHDNKIAYAAISSRTHKKPLNELCELLNYTPIAFKAYGLNKELIYHTNVIMCVGETFIAIAIDIIDEKDINLVMNSILKSGKEAVFLSKQQAHFCFAGNMLQIKNNKNKTILLTSQKAFQSLTISQLETLRNHNDIVLSIPIPIIETYGGGSVRCMVAEVFQPNRNL